MWLVVILIIIILVIALALYTYFNNEIESLKKQDKEIKRYVVTMDEEYGKAIDMIGNCK